MGISSQRGPTLGNQGEGSSTGDFEMDERGSVDELPPSLFEEASQRGPGEDFLRWGHLKILSGRRMQASLYGGPSVVRERELVCR
jgi:hypothetical protein